MVEEVKKAEEGQKEEVKKDEKKEEEIVMKVFMHCEGCARKVKRSLKGFVGVEEVMTDSKNHKVIVKGKNAAEDPMKVVDRVAKKTGRKVELLTPLPLPKPEKEVEKVKEVEMPKPEEKKEEAPLILTVVLKVYMHCEACSQEIKKGILKMKGVETAEVDLKASQVTVKGIFEPPKLVEHVYKKNGKHAVIVKQDSAEKKADDDKKAEAAGDVAKDEKKSNKDGDKASDKDAKSDSKDKKDGNAAPEDPVAAAANVKVELLKNEFQYNPYRMPYSSYQYPPQMFSDENPNACTVM